MKTNIMRMCGILTTAAFLTCFGSDHVYAQVTVTTVQTNAPAVVGYVAQPRGLFGWRTTYQPIIGNVPVQKTVTVQQTPAYVARPVAVQPIPVPATYVPAPVVVPARTYLAPVPPTPVPVTNYYTPLYSRYRY